jgi:hypothetical protein
MGRRPKLGFRFISQSNPLRDMLRPLRGGQLVATPRGRQRNRWSGHLRTIGERQWHRRESRGIFSRLPENEPHFACPILLNTEPFVVPGVTNDGHAAINRSWCILRYIDCCPRQPLRSPDQDKGMIGVVICVCSW